MVYKGNSRAKPGQLQRNPVSKIQKQTGKKKTLKLKVCTYCYYYCVSVCPGARAPLPLQAASRLRQQTFVACRAFLPAPQSNPLFFFFVIVSLRCQLVLSSHPNPLTQGGLELFDPPASVFSADGMVQLEYLLVQFISGTFLTPSFWHTGSPVQPQTLG